MVGSYYPLRLKSIEKEKVWGGRNLERLLGKRLPTGAHVGETWEAWEGCAIENGALAGRTLQELIGEDAAGILGPAGSSRFPLLFKYIDAQDDLSVQVHPDDARAQAMEHQPFGKTEAWYILKAEPGARLILGFKKNADAGQVAAAIENKHLVDLLSFVPVQQGDVIFVPAGTIHAIGRGIVLAEIQENSDITYRLYDWDRQGNGRELHVDQSLKVFAGLRVEHPKIPPIVLHHSQFDERFLVACRYFVLTLCEIDDRSDALNTKGRFQILSVVEGAADILHGLDFSASVSAKQGQTLLLPAGLGAFAIRATEPSKILRMFVPDLRRDVIAPLLQAGYDAQAIVRLGGGIPDQNDLANLL
jgi:mannose-6-phosphate isomerase